MKKQWAALAAAFLIGSSFPAPAEEINRPMPDQTATNMEAAYPSVDGFLPPEPDPPAEGVRDFENFKKYMDAVNEYVRAAQKYIDGATTDANDIIKKRNDAVQKAQQVVDRYNASLPKEEKK